MYSWGTNSMGQCGQGHSTSSVTKPGRVNGLEGVQVQQISAGTSHSIVWTAVPMDRYVIVVCSTVSILYVYNAGYWMCNNRVHTVGVRLHGV